jgi:hypothetical protein
MIRAKVKPGLVEDDDGMLCSIALDFKHSQKSPGQTEALAVLRV